MSQITRCPSCGTTFKVVADQLRISEGWVRCGQCKEVFDASAHLLPAVAPALLPDVSLTDVRPPPVPVARTPEPARAWGAPPSTTPVPAPAPDVVVPTESVWVGDSPAEPVLDVPDPAVPAFLSVGPGGMPPQEGAEPLSPFAWRPRPAPPAEPPPPLASTGYELPSSLEPLDPDEALDRPPFAETQPADLLDLDALRALDLAARPPQPSAEATTMSPAPQEPEEEALALADDDSPVAALQALARKMARDPEDTPDDGAEPAALAEPEPEEVSFVVAARRKAFWRKPAVRAALALLLLLSALALALQVVVHERDRIAAVDARARPWLARLCVPLQCKIAPHRQIDDVVIDSSSFNKARGDSYQLALAIKSRASIPLAMPAVELTLTDAQDQAVLRRVLLPSDLGAPAELAARGEWSTTASVIVTTGGARVAGYRLLAFYP
ncbi:MAG: DUF3426 domain-containing protein [Acidovorax sp.]|uniref:DUF3426 domain-containing protein n=1 Tax=Acidovorax sp. TaxID=1872122 RepID=UPI0039E346C5